MAYQSRETHALNPAHKFETHRWPDIGRDGSSMKFENVTSRMNLFMRDHICDQRTHIIYIFLLFNMEETKMEGLTAEEAAVYDRQLRVWGVEAQQRYGGAARMSTTIK